jgi:hypothetical protein
MMAMVSCHPRNAALAIRADFSLVMPGLDPGIHHLRKKLDCRVKPAMTDKQYS